MIVEYDKETNMVYVSKKLPDRWVQVGFTEDEAKQIAFAHPAINIQIELAGDMVWFTDENEQKESNK
jgi:hypothetical protein